MKRIFVGGMGRSGTTISVNMFDNQRECFAVPIETKFLVEEDGFCDLIEAMTSRFSPPTATTAFERFERQMRDEVTGSTPSKYADLHQYAPAIFPSYHDALDRFIGIVLTKRYFADREPLVAAARQFLVETFDYTARISDKIGWVEKTPGNIWRLDFLRELFPDSYFLHMIRHPLDIYYSLREKAWLPDGLVPSLIMFEGYCAALAKQRRRWLADPRFIEIKLEQLVSHPKPTMQEIMQRCGLSPMSDEGMESVIATMNRYYENKQTKVSRDLNPQDECLVIEMLQPWAIEFGYQGMR